MKPRKAPRQLASRLQSSLEELVHAGPAETFRVDTLVKLADGTISRQTERLTKLEWLTKRSTKGNKPLVAMTASQVKAIRLSLGVSQLAFAHWLHVSPQAVQKWEQKTGVADGPILRLLHIIRDDLPHWTKEIRQQVTA